MKQSEIKELSLEQLEEKLVAMKGEYATMKVTHALTPLENPLSLRKTRRSIARLATELTNRAIQ